MQAQKMMDKPVFVTSYPRYRFGRWEHVCKHYRSAPHR